jgi:hypothetical protein
LLETYGPKMVVYTAVVIEDSIEIQKIEELFIISIIFSIDYIGILPGGAA